jgi:transcriptional antiterminator NusG
VEESSTDAGTGDDFYIDLGSDFTPDRSEDDLDINLDFGGAAATEEAEDDFDIDLGAPEPEADEDEDGEEASDEADPAEEALAKFHEELHGKFGDWYVVHTYSGMENRVLQNLENRVTSLNMEDYIFEIVVPTEEVTEIRNGQRKQIKRTVLPGYVLVRMDLTDESWSTVRHTPSVTGFVGHSNQPVPLSLDEVEKMLAPSVAAAAIAGSDTPTRRKKKVEVAAALTTRNSTMQATKTSIDNP